MVAQPGGRVKGFPLAVGLAPTLCGRLKECVSAMM